MVIYNLKEHIEVVSHLQLQISSNLYRWRMIALCVESKLFWFQRCNFKNQCDFNDILVSQKTFGEKFPTFIGNERPQAYTLVSVKSNMTNLKMKPNPTEARKRFVHFVQTLFEIALWDCQDQDREKEKSGAGREVESK
jgi:hypothetical protein